jgi:hypothetical protein
MRNVPKPDSVALKFLLGLLFVLGIARAVPAQGIIASAELRGQSVGGGLYDYTVTLISEPNSHNPIATFWFGWVPGASFLPSSPTSVSAPAGWTYSIEGGPYYMYGYPYYDGYSIEYTTSTTPLQPGASLNFGFVSADSPAALAGDSPWHPGYQVGTSYVYSGIGSGNNSVLFAQLVPEPSSLVLLAAWAAGLWVAGWRRRRS